MDKPRRVLKTLTCLVGAMTGTATLLAWMDPSLPFTPDPVDFDDLQAAVDELVFEGTDLGPASWDAVEIVTDLDGPARSAMLAGRPDGPTWHFYIDGRGRLSRSEHWYRQWPVPEAPERVRIAVAGSGPGAPMAEPQGRCLQVLVAALNHALSRGDGRALSIEVDENWAAAYGLAPRTSLPASPGGSRPVDPTD
jgi:hypothetical protein